VGVTRSAYEKKQMLKGRDVAERINLSRETVLRWTRDGKLPGHRFASGAIRYDEAEVEAWIASQAISTMSAGDEPRDPKRPEPEVSPESRPKKRGGKRHAGDSEGTGVQAQLW
jgi:excisionase family DNA binding protein